MALETVGSCLNLEEFRKYVAEKNFGVLPADKIVLHHTWRPTVDQWQGKKSFDGLVSYYTSKGWNAAPHLFIAPDGIWLMTDMRKDGIHAGKLNYRSIGIEVVGDYDTTVWAEPIKSLAVGVLKILKERLKIENEKIFFHRDVSPKTCPGAAITKQWVFQQLELKEVVSHETVSPWAKEAWQWFKDNHFDDSIHPQQNLSAESVVFYLKKVYDMIKYGK